jgi:YjbE family integral membrane protein
MVRMPRSIAERNGFHRTTSFFAARSAPQNRAVLYGAEFWTALAAIVVIDLALAGDNAIVIALAARNLQGALRRRAVVWGALGAVAVRGSLTVAALWLLQIPGLMAAGGVALVWIAYRLLVSNGSPERAVAPAASCWAAVRTIVIADAVMGLENVLAVAGAANGSALLVFIGLLVSIPIMVYGSTLVLRLLERFPGLVYVGGAVLAWTAAHMIVGERLLAELFEQRRALPTALYAAVLAGVLGAAWLRNRKLRLQSA